MIPSPPNEGGEGAEKCALLVMRRYDDVYFSILSKIKEGQFSHVLFDTRIFINKKGIVTEAWVQKGIPNTGLNEAALEAVKKSKWKPAQQRDKKVGVWQTVPVKFELTSH